MMERDKYIKVDGMLVKVPEKTRDYNSLADYIIQEEGFLNNPTNIGDGKITLGSGLTDPKWHKLYKQRGNKWSKEDNKKAVIEEIKSREKALNDSFPNWNRLPIESQNALLSYNFNYNFTPSNSPKLYQAARDFNYLNMAAQMDATSKDPKFKKGLIERRKREQEMFLSGFPTWQNMTTSPIIERPDALRVATPYPTQAQNTFVASTMVPDESSYINAHPQTVSEDRANRVRSTFDAINNYNRLMEAVRIQNNPTPQYVPENAPYIVSSYSEGGTINQHKLWDDLSMTEKAEMMKVAVRQGITNLSDIKQRYNEFAKGGHTIHIKPENRGKFTALKEKTGHSATWFKEHGTPAERRMATFELNARHWKHAEGGNLFDGESQLTQQMIRHKPYYDTDGSLHYNIDLPETVIIPDSQLSPAERNYRERMRQRNLPDYAEQKDREQTNVFLQQARKDWENSAEKKALDYAQSITTGVGIGADIVSRLPVYSSLKGARVLSEAKTPMDYIEGGLWLTPILGSAYNTTKPAITQAIDNALAQAQQIGRGIDSPFEFAENIYNYAKRKPIPFAEKQAAAQRMENLIHSPEYIERQKAASLSDSEIVDFQSMVSRRLNGGNFPAYTMKRKANGLSLTLPKPFGGIYMREGIPYSDFLNAFDHEVAHYSTVNFGKTDNQLLKLLNRENPTITEKIMGYNINKVPYRPETDAPKVRTARGLDPHTDKLNYYRDEQEVRSNAYAILQEAQRRGITVDDLVDHYTMQSTGEIFGLAPAPLRYLNYAYTPENIKKFTKGFLSFTAPLTFGIKYMNQDAK